MQTTIIPDNGAISENTKLNLTGGLLQIGESLNEYIIKSKVPSDSGEAEIYLCEKTGQTFVVKYYFNCKPKTEVIEKLKNIKNPDIVTLYEFGEYKDHFYEIMEYAAGGSLDSKDVNGKFKYLPVTEDTAVQIVREVVNAFNECHKAGIIHRDIKPGNLFYKNADGSDILVGDFGISSYYDVDDGMSKHLTQTSARTEGYTAPEVYSGVIGPEIDYYSLGVTLWELLTAKNPFMTVDEKPMFSASIMLETIQGKMADTLIARAPKLSQKMKILIRGLMTVRHEKRWNYESVIKFLDGEEVPVYIESNQIPAVTVGETVCTSYKEIATAILTDMEIGKSFVYKGGLGRYLVKIDKEFANKISDEIDEFSAKGNLEEGLFTIAYKLCPNLDFKLSEKTSFSSLTELISILETKPKELLPYLMDESKNFYLYLKVIGLGEAAKKIWEITKSSVNDYLLISKIILLLNGNSIAPFADGVNDKIVLSDIHDVQKLSDPLKKRLLLMIDGYDKNVCAWFENQTGVNILDWRNAISDFYYPEEKMYFSKWDMFNMFADENYTPSLSLPDEEKIFDNIKFFTEKNNQRLVNLIFDKTWNLLFENRKFKVCLDLLNLISGNIDGLKHDINFYKAKRLQCLYELGEYQDALLLLESIEESPETLFVYKYCALSAYNLDEENNSLNYVNKALSQNPDDYELYELKGKILFGLEDYEEAIAAFTMALDTRECRKTYLNRARCYEKLAEDDAPDLQEKAEADREKAENIDVTDFTYEFEKEFGNKKNQPANMNVFTVGKEDGCDYQNIQQAIDSVTEGSIIRVLPGVYKENLNIAKRVKLAGCEDYIGNKSSNELPVVVFDAGYSCKIDIPVYINGIVFTQNQELRFDKLRDYVNKEEEIEKPENPGNYGEENFQTILWVDAECNLKNIAVINGENYGITFSADTSVLEYSFVGKTKDNGLYCMEKSSPKIKYTNVANCTYPNVYFGDNTIAELDSCNIYNSQNNGICGVKDSDCTLRDCFIYNNRKKGIGYSGNSQGNVFDCEIYENQETGINYSDNSQGNVSNSEIYANKQNGICILANAKPEIAGCKIHDNTKIGLLIGGDANPTVTVCDIHNTENAGVGIAENATPKITDCKIHDSNQIGLLIAGNANPTVTVCDIYNTEKAGVGIVQNATPKITDCKIHDSNQIGLLIEDDANPILKNCKIHNTNSDGILNNSSKSVDTSSCECWENGDEWYEN